ncbi:SpaA isopeptide-forming pilin-related protein [Proteiniclasticum sp.]|uniref:SpaA isopeptide-forming pilin-related protein n=1 Tax=Proteiniclasticum sp. TaxID=2053595 RepID=UPI00289DAD8A|nr:SpaA isopeptide-forming pilin-related protein [Proteiniclasticum sp.]
MRVGKDKSSKRRYFFSILILFSFMISILPGGMRNTRAEELNREETLTKIELSAEVIWTGVPDGESVPDTTITLMSGEVVVESIEVTDGSTLVKFTPVDELDAEGNVILYSVDQEPLENYKTVIREFVIENTFIPPVVEEPTEVGSKSIVEEPKTEEPKTEEPVEEPVEEPKTEEPVEEPKTEEPVEEPKVVEQLDDTLSLNESGDINVSDEYTPVINDGFSGKLPTNEPVGPDGVILSEEVYDYATVSYSGVPGTQIYTPVISRSFAPMMQTLSGTFTSPVNPGDVTIGKTAVPVEGLVNTWEITLRIEGKDTQKTSDIVLVIDRSGSMRGDKLVEAKAAAVQFVNELGGTTYTRIAIVSFASESSGSTVTLEQDFTNNIADLEDAIDDLVANGGTHTQAAIRYAAGILKSPNSTADLKNIVLLSDGQPTFSYAIKNGEHEYVYYSPGNYVTSPNQIESDYNYPSTVGNGSDGFAFINSVGGNSNWYSHGNSTIAEAGFFKNTVEVGKQRTLWTIAFDAGGVGNAVLNSVASPGKAFTASPGDLNTIFQQIAGSINSAAKDTVVVDPMAAGFEIPASEIPTKTQGTVAYAGGVLTWTVGDLSQEISPGSNIRYAELKYRVSINDSILGLTVPADGLYPTNGDAEVSYKDSNNVTQELHFPIPKVNPIFLKVKKILMDADGKIITDPNRQFPIKIMSDAEDGDTIYAEYNETYNLIPDQLITKTNLRLADTYTVSENAPDYDVTIKVNGAVTSTFVIQPPVGTADSGQPDIEVEVTNKEKPLGKLILNKILLDENNDPIVGDLREFTFNITGPDGYNTTRVLKGGETKEIPGLKYGEYTVVEADQVNLTAAGFTITSDPTDGKVTLAWNNKEDTVEITNKYVSPKISVIAKKLWEGGKDVDHVAVTLTLYRQIGAGLKTEVTGVTPSIVPASGTASEFTYTWSNLPKTDKFGDLYIYTVDELTVPTGYDKSISEDGLTVTNRSKISSFQLTKTGVDGVELAGAEFDLYREVESTTPFAVAFNLEGGGIIYGIRIPTAAPNGRLTTGANGKTQIVENLEAGDYFVIEIVAPEGYLLHEYPIPFTIDVTITLNEITVSNEEAPMIPATGGMGTMLFTILGIGIMGGALFGFKKHNYNNRGKGENIMKGRKLFTLLFTMLVLFVFVAPSIASATTTPTPNPRPPLHSGETDVTIHKMELFEDPRLFDPAKSLPADHDGTLLDETALNNLLGSGNYKPLPGVKFSYWKLDMTKPAGQLTLAYLDAASIATLNSEHVFKGELTTSDPAGTIFIEDLEDGYYFFKETFTPANVDSHIAVPFILGLPVMNSDGTDYLDSVHIYPKEIATRGAVVLQKFIGKIPGEGEVGVPLPGAKFRLYEGTPEVPDGEYVPEGGAAQEYTTNAAGEIILNNLPRGFYYFVETATVDSYLLNTEPLEFEIDSNGKVLLDGLLRDDIVGTVEFVKLDNYEGPEIEKSIGEIGQEELDATVGDDFEFFIELDLPEDVDEYTTLTVTDVIDTKLDYVGPVVVKGFVGAVSTTLTEGTHYTQSYTPGNRTLLVTLIPDKLNNGTVNFDKVEISFFADINETAVMGVGIKNEARVDFNNGYTPGHDTDDAYAFTGGIRFMKKSTQEPNGIDGAQFIILNDAETHYLTKVANEFVWVVLPVNPDYTNLPGAIELTSGANGLFEIQGLAYGDYKLLEIVAPMYDGEDRPYNLEDDPWTFTITKLSYYSNPEGLEYANPYHINNILGPKIPQTGGIGTVLFTVIGGGLMGSALMLNRKRSKA